MTQWLLNRLFDRNSQPNPQYAFQGTVNWMKALSVLVSNNSFDADKIKEFYNSVPRRNINTEADTTVFENMFMAIHNQSSLECLVSQDDYSYDICRSAIINWYYSTYFTCSAMISAQDGSIQETHASTAKVWHASIVDRGLAMLPFSLNFSNLIKKDNQAEILAYNNGNTNNHPLSHTYSTNNEEALGAALSFLNGTANYRRWQEEKKIKNHKSFKLFNVTTFRTKQAIDFRDNHFSKHKVNYLVQAFRYRGKANYRDSIFLSYGHDNTDLIKEFISDLDKVSNAFQRMAGHYLSKRIERGTWTNFIDDLEQNSRLSINLDYLRC